MFSIGHDDFTKETIIEYLTCRGEKQNELFDVAAGIRNDKNDKNIYLRGVIELSNYCSCQCKFCGNASYAKDINRYRITFEDLKEQIDLANEYGISVIHLASGDDKGYDFGIVLRAVRYMKSLGIESELALGRLKDEEYRALYDSGARRFILKFETSDSDLYSNVKTCGSTLNDNIGIIRMLKSIGFKVGSGNMIGLPGQRIESIADDILLLKELDVDMASTSVFTPNKESLFKDEKAGDPNIGLNYLALVRILLNKKLLSIPTNSTLGTFGKLKALTIASNEMSFNMTPKTYSDHYSIYSGKDRYKDNYKDIQDKVSSIGFKLTGIDQVL